MEQEPTIYLYLQYKTKRTFNKVRKIWDSVYMSPYSHLKLTVLVHYSDPFLVSGCFHCLSGNLSPTYDGVLSCSSWKLCQWGSNIISSLGRIRIRPREAIDLEYLVFILQLDPCITAQTHTLTKNISTHWKMNYFLLFIGTRQDNNFKTILVLWF